MVILGGLVSVPIFFFNAVNDAAALLFARGTDYLAVFDKPQRDAFVMLLWLVIMGAKKPYPAESERTEKYV